MAVVGHYTAKRCRQQRGCAPRSSFVTKAAACRCSVFVTRPAESRLAHLIWRTIRYGRLSIGMSYDWNYQSVKEHHGCCNYEEDAFHGGFLLVLENRAVIFSCPQPAVIDHFGPLTVRNS
jgi:hypothetical protein